MDSHAQSVLRELGVDLTTFRKLTDAVAVYCVRGGEPAVQLWHALRQRSDVLPGWPVIAGSEQNFKYIQETLTDATRPSVQAILDSVPSGNPITARREAELASVQAIQRYYKENGLEVPSYLDDSIAHFSSPQSDILPPPPDLSVWPSQPPARQQTIASAYSLEGEPLESCLFAVVQGAAPTDVPAYLGCGGFNACPPSQIHVSFLRDWNRRYGAVPAAITHDVIELFIPRAIATPTEAWKVACEHEPYCGEDNLLTEERALRIWQSPYWDFWWD